MKVVVFFFIIIDQNDYKIYFSLFDLKFLKYCRVNAIGEIKQLKRMYHRLIFSI